MEERTIIVKGRKGLVERKGRGEGGGNGAAEAREGGTAPWLLVLLEEGINAPGDVAQVGIMMCFAQWCMLIKWSSQALIYTTSETMGELTAIYSELTEIYFRFRNGGCVYFCTELFYDITWYQLR